MGRKCPIAEERGNNILKKTIGLAAIILLFALTLASLLSSPISWAGDGTCSLGATEAAQRWYFAEGHTGSGLDEYLCVMNPGTQDAQVQVNLIFPTEPSRPHYLMVPPHSRGTLYINALVGRDSDVSLLIESSAPVVVERPMYFIYGGRWKGCTNVLGATAPSTTWSFAEGCTRPGFEEWLCLMNPQQSPSQVNISMHLNDGREIPRSISIPPGQRRTLFINQEVGGAYDVSLHLRSDLPVVAERVIYFNYRGWQGGHASLGEISPITVRYFAEGHTSPIFDTYLCLYSPTLSAEGPNTTQSTEPVQVTVTYYFDNGATQQQSLLLPKNLRYTILVNSVVGQDRNLSIKVDGGGQAVMAERPIYFNYRGYCRGGHVTSGAAQPHTSWCFAEGNTRPGFEEYLCVLNPNPEVATVAVDFITGAGEVISRSYQVQASKRFTIDVSQEVPRGQDVSCVVSSSQPVVAERPIYYPSPYFEPLNAMGHLYFLSVTIGPRTQGSPQEEAAAQYLRGALGSYGYQTSIQDVPLPNGAYTHNVVGKLAPSGNPSGLLVLGGHFDTALNTGSPGANDNGSGTVTALEMARCLATNPPPVEIWVVFFGGEEILVPNTDYHHFGSRYFVQNLSAEDRARLRGAIVLDMVGVGSVLYARNMQLGPMTLCNALLAYAQSIGFYLPYKKSGNQSDHGSFEQAGLPAVWMEVMTDPYWHTPQDSIDKINPSYLQNTGNLLLGFIYSPYLP